MKNKSKARSFDLRHFIEQMVGILLSSPFLSVPLRPRSSISSSSSSNPVQRRYRTFAAMDFPHLSPAHRDLMLDLLSTTNNRLGDHLLPSSVPADVLSFQNDAGNCSGALDIRLGDAGSKVDFVLESWLHCDLPFGALDIATLFIFLRPATDAPHLLMEFIQSGPNSLVLFIDLLPRRDLVLHSDYLHHFYEETSLEKIRQRIQSAAEAKPYLSSSMYIRSALSPTAIAFTIDCSSLGARSMEELMKELISGAAKEVVEVWGDCALAEREVAAGDKPGLTVRDDVMKKKTVEIDLAANLPRLFGPEVAGRVVSEIQKAFGI